MMVKVDGKETDIRGKVNLFYAGQPYFCRACESEHTDRCPQYAPKQRAESEAETIRKSLSKTLIIGDSNLRRVNERAFYTKTDCAPGAKIGHVANSLLHTRKDEHEVVIVHAGQNNVLQDNNIDIEAWKTHTTTEVSSLEKQITKFKKSIIVGVPPAPWCKKSRQTIAMRQHINDSLRKVAHENLNIKYIDIEQEDQDDDANWEDERHMTEKFQGYVLGKIAAKMQELNGKIFYVNNVPWTSKSKHGQVTTTYPLGCEVCTATGHSRYTCPRNKQGTKRNLSSSAESSTAKAAK